MTSLLIWIGVPVLIGVILGVRRAVRDLRREDHVGWLYFIGNSTGAIKVGITRGSPQERLADLQTGNPRRLKVLYAMQVNNLQEAEGRAHNLLAEAHISGEWYQREPAMGLIWALKMRDEEALNGPLLYPTEE